MNSNTGDAGSSWDIPNVGNGGPGRARYLRNKVASGYKGSDINVANPGFVKLRDVATKPRSVGSNTEGEMLVQPIPNDKHDDFD